MEALVADARKMILNGSSLIDLIDFLRSVESFKLTPLNFMRVLNEAVGIRMMESRRLVSMFDAEMEPIMAEAVVELRWRSTVDSHSLNDGPTSM
ncbi:hypothetical protein [Streptomyces sp. NRRL F-5126]|uniref:hypothetical protein n=1 Tax=Streptomyces sp. NRRL F-5126 TaxID=1463857 RepID=UPI0004C6ED58|nr:hypothetical protein [Streptomyces sp. NRRL F-5126]